MPELRKDPIVGRWVIIATERAKRPHDYHPESDRSIESGGVCPFCPGEEHRTPKDILVYAGAGPGRDWAVRVFPNRYPALKIEGGLDREGDGVYDRMNGVGAHEVVVETPDHQKQLADLTDEEIARVLAAWRDRILDLERDRRLRYVMVFKNHRAAAGASVLHSHSQLIALPTVPKNVADEMKGSLEYYQFKERCVFCDIVAQEQRDRRRVVHENGAFLVVEPYAPKFPFETWILPKHHRSAYEDCPPADYLALAGALGVSLRKLRRALDDPPYNFILHTSPFQDRHIPYYHWHIEIMPTLSPVAGFEWGSGFYINPTPPEEAAAFLRELDV
ncbi:MAG: galactose-1-phosphate uridylyltransferase [Myxococcales bacterium]|nr:galactose-1-phosphate uridylyltransferase [Myxococcales bacterium]